MVDPMPIKESDASFAGRSQDAYGQVALLLVESLIHGLLARSVISVDDAVDIVGDAVDVTREVADEPGISLVITEKSLAILQTIRASLSIDLPDRSARAWPPNS